jgi:uncharacterized protein (DUF2141 family)
MNAGRLFVALLALAAACCASRAPSPQPLTDVASSGPASLTVRVLGLRSDEGKLALALYDSEESFDTRSGAVTTDRIAPVDGAVSWEVREVSPGTYAVAVYHDLNGNGKLDRSAVGVPTEPYGFSNDARGSFGPPGFRKAAFEIGPGTTTIEITVR